MMNSFHARLFFSLAMLPALLLLSSAASAGCGITIELKNTDSIKVSYVKNGSKVKSKGGSWKALPAPVVRSMEPGETVSFVHNATFGCNAKRRYKLKFVKLGHQWYEHFPSATGWTKNVNIRINAKK